MTTQQHDQPPSAASLDPATRVGLLALTVADLAREIAFYTDAFGFAVLARDTSTATLGVGGTPLLLLAEQLGSPLAPERATGLYHFAILVPSQADLGRWLRHWLDAGYPLPGQGDHLVSEALYLSDPEANGIEIYRDRPRDQWRWVNGRVQMATDPVDLRGLLAAAERDGATWSGLSADTRLGHMHLKVGDIAQAETFYHGVLGFDIVAQMPTALFVSAGGYHHHIGMNTWHSRGSGPAPAGSAGLRFYTIELPNAEARASVVARLDDAGVSHTQTGDVVVFDDPWRNTILLQVGPVTDAQVAQALVAAYPTD